LKENLLEPNVREEISKRLYLKDINEFLIGDSSIFRALVAAPQMAPVTSPLMIGRRIRSANLSCPGYLVP
jgi:hypothetical protein